MKKLIEINGIHWSAFSYVYIRMYCAYSAEKNDMLIKINNIPEGWVVWRYNPYSFIKFLNTSKEFRYELMNILSEALNNGYITYKENSEIILLDYDLLRNICNKGFNYERLEIS